MSTLGSTAFWLGLLKIIGINILLSGENAVAIALAARGLPLAQQKKAILLGSGIAVILLTTLTALAAKLLTISFFQIMGGLLLLWVGVQLLSENHKAEGETKAHGTLLAAVRTILVADLIMSLDNVIGVAAAAQGNFLLLVLGLAISIPIVIFGSTVVMRLMARWPIIITMGAGLIGWVAGQTIMSDTVFTRLTSTYPLLPELGGALGIVLVLVVGQWLSKRHG